MGYAVGWSSAQKRDIGYGVPCKCEHPDCDEDINRGMGYACGGDHDGGRDGERGCGRYFCGKHGGGFYCERCDAEEEPFAAKPDTAEWTDWKMRHPSWAKWRAENGHPEPVDPIKDEDDPPPTDAEIEEILAKSDL